MPTVQGTDDFNHAIDAGYYTDGFFGTPTQIGTPLYQGQPKSLQIVTDGGNVGARHNITGTPTMGWMAFPFWTPAHPGSGAAFVASFGQTGGAQVGALVHSTVGLYTTIGGDNGVESTVSANAWHWVEMILDVSTGTHTVYCRVDGVDIDTASVAQAATTITWSQMISFAGDPAGVTHDFGMWKWGSAASTTDWLGEPTFGAGEAGPTLIRVIGNRQVW